jgi:signal transduction histidine kinase
MAPNASSERTSIPTLEVPPTPTGTAPSDIAEAPAPQDDALKHLTSVLTRHLAPLTNQIARHADRLVDAPDPQRRRESAMDVMAASARIDDLLAALRHYSCPAEASPRRVPVPEIVEGTVRLLDDAKQARVRTKVEPEADVSLKADPALLRQALLNLLTNGLEATAAPETVLLRAAHADGPPDAAPEIAFEVWNDGEIELDDPSVVFQPFYSARPQRLGLGLPIAAHIAEQHGGSLRLATNSAASGGTCFTLEI